MASHLCRDSNNARLTKRPSMMSLPTILYSKTDTFSLSLIPEITALANCSVTPVWEKYTTAIRAIFCSLIEFRAA